jgi:hypothetical protein
VAKLSLPSDHLAAVRRLLERLAERLDSPEQRFLSIDQAATYAGVPPKSIRRPIACHKLTAQRRRRVPKKGGPGNAP